MNKAIYIVGLMIISICSTSFGTGNVVSSNGNSSINISTNTVIETSDEKWLDMVNEGESLLHEQQAEDAIRKYFDPVIEQFNAISSTNSAQIFCARDSKETLVYLMYVAALSDKEELKDIPLIWGAKFAEQKDGAVVFSQFWADAFYLKAYALVELGEIGQAKKFLQTAVGLSPLNFNFLAELGHIYQLERNWDMALAAFEAAERAVEFSDPDTQDVRRARAWRGLGYVYIELGKLQEAKEKYQQCLELNPNDRSALAELKYIEGLQSR